jgi:hypothetical protein
LTSSVKRGSPTLSTSARFAGAGARPDLQPARAAQRALVEPRAAQLQQRLGDLLA